MRTSTTPARTRGAAVLLSLVTALAPLASALASPRATASAMGATPTPLAVMAQVQRIAATMRTSRYSHDTRVDVGAGRYEFDCSGMVAWVLRRSAPQAHLATMRRASGRRPLARDYYLQIAASSADRPSRGWLRVARVADARPGDVVAWLRPDGRRRANTGHVLFVVETPRPVRYAPGAYEVRVADASAYQHADDTRAGTGRDGFGMGTMLLFADETTGAVRGYGWRAGFPAWGRDARIAIGRPVR